MKILLDKIKNFYFICWNKFKNFTINTNIIIFTLIYSIFTIIVYNIKFFKLVYNIDSSVLHIVASFILLSCIFNIFFTLIFQKKITKFFSIFFLLCNAGILYFMNIYNIEIDKVMILNARETDMKETLELLNFVFFKNIFILGVLPSIIILKTNINYGKWFKQISFKILSIIISLIIGLSILFLGYKDISSTARRNRKLKNIIIPYNYINANVGLLESYMKKGRYKFENITEDAVIIDDNLNNGKKNLVIFVVGEASREKNWSLGKYEKDTNEYLKNENLIFYDNFFSCGTSTAISVPCMFSVLSRSDFKIEKRDAYSNLLDFLQKVGFNVMWRDNNSGCKGVCNRVNTDDFTKGIGNKKFCKNGECFDEILVDDLQSKIIDLNSQNNFIVLHQKGSHGPAYYLRYPNEFEKFKPTCNSEYFDKCTDEEIVNSYNNTIYYTSFILNKTIEILKDNEDKYNVALIYVSDHGQSLGEKGMYLHGAPYKFSPEEQRHIPFLMWFSNDFKKSFKIDEKCLKDKRNNSLSHDNIFHSVLGLFGIKTQHYKEELDIFSKCISK